MWFDSRSDAGKISNSHSKKKRIDALTIEFLVNIFIFKLQIGLGSFWGATKSIDLHNGGY
jgi:hypothetical protein